MTLLQYRQKLKNYKITKNKTWKNSSKQPQDPIKGKINISNNLGFWEIFEIIVIFYRS